MVEKSETKVDRMEDAAEKEKGEVEKKTRIDCERWTTGGTRNWSE